MFLQEVVAYVEDEAQAYLLITALPGPPVYEFTDDKERKRAVHILADRLHLKLLDEFF